MILAERSRRTLAEQEVGKVGRQKKEEGGQEECSKCKCS